jgi:hypothetical protein
VRHGRRSVVDGALVQLAHGLSAERPGVLPVQVAVSDRGPAAALPSAELPRALAPHAHEGSASHTCSNASGRGDSGFRSLFVTINRRPQGPSALAHCDHAGTCSPGSVVPGWARSRSGRKCGRRGHHPMAARGSAVVVVLAVGQRLRRGCGRAAGRPRRRSAWVLDCARAVGPSHAPCDRRGCLPCGVGEHAVVHRWPQRERRTARVWPRHSVA